MPFLTVGQWRVLLVAGCALLVAAGWRFVHGSGGGPVVLEPAAQLEGCQEAGMEGGGAAPGGTTSTGSGAAGADPDAIGDVAGGAGDGLAGQWHGEGPAEAAGPAAGDGRIDVNRADAAQLQQLPGIGPVLAARIIEHRERWGPFSAPEDLLEVSGIGPRVLARIRDRIHVGEP